MCAKYDKVETHRLRLIRACSRYKSLFQLKFLIKFHEITVNLKIHFVKTYTSLIHKYKDKDLKDNIPFVILH